MFKEYKKELYYLFGVDKNIKTTDSEIQIEHFIMTKRNIFVRQCIYNPEDIIKKSQIVQRNQELWKLEKEVQKIRKKIYNQTKNIQEEKIPANEQLKVKNELKRINNVLKDIRKEKQMTYSIMREIENKKTKK